jgi:ribonuclease HI
MIAPNNPSAVHPTTLSLPSSPDIIVDASWADGIGGIAYVSATIGLRALVRYYGNATEAEMDAVLLAMHDAQREDHHKIVIGTDNQVAALVRTVTPWSGPFMRRAASEIRCFLDEMPAWELVHIPRYLTQRAHVLARNAMRDRRREHPTPPVHSLARYPYSQ